MFACNYSILYLYAKNYAFKAKVKSRMLESGILKSINEMDF